MDRFWLILMFAAALSFSLLTFTGSGGGAADAPAAGESKQAGFELPQKHKSPLGPAAQRGADLYAYYCSHCHGKTGEGDGFNSFQLTTPPAKHADATLMSALSDAEMERVIKKGGPALGRSPQMPPWGGVLTDQQVADLAAFIRVLSKK
jgi:mono/diheme cytochrome c family protein